MQEEVDNHKIPNLLQIQQQLVTSKQNLRRVLNSIDLSKLNTNHSQYQNVCGKNSIESVIDSLPSEQALSSMVGQTSKHAKLDTIQNYKGNYKLVREIKDHLDEAKPQAIDTYFLLAQIKPMHLSSDEQYIKNWSELHSWKIHGDDQKQTKHQRNALHDKYRQSLKWKENKDLQKQQYLPDLLNQDELVVHVSFYDSHLMEKQNEFICYGREPLSHLRDSFYCLIQELDERNDKSSFIFIEDVFYQDCRAGTHSLTQSIMQKSKTQGQNYIRMDMGKTILGDLRVQVGKPYVFRHLEGCDHMLVFNQVRLIDFELDLRVKKEYPVNIFQKRLKRRRCEGCDLKFAALIVLEDRMKNGDNGYYCEVCYTDMFLNSDKQPKYSYLEVVKYLHD